MIGPVAESRYRIHLDRIDHNFIGILFVNLMICDPVF